MPEGIESRLANNGGITFTVNNAVTDVSLVLVATPDLSVNGVIMNFPYGENCILKGFSFSFPYQYGQGEMDQGGGTNPMFVQLGWRDLTGNNGSLNEVGDTGLINIPDCNVWYDMDVFIPCPSNSDSKWHIEIVGCLGEVSMINSPVALDTEELDVVFHLKAFHTLALIA